ncbi:MAG TPA: M50 family metallopeptidase [Solirubrobacterales bacterium]|jgi:regulator of sigma E protease|nr:M50 family metallopeptidase [Solirubrobacterales bacterium]
MSWVLVFLGFSLLIILHEAGHFFAAKATGMRVERFFLFFGPKLVSVKRGETEYGIAAIPAGGYVKISGMHPEDKLPPGEEHRGYYEQPVWKRIVVIGAGPAVNIALAVAILFVLALTSSVKPTQTVGDIVPGSPAATALKPGDRILAIDGKSYPHASAEARLNHFVDDVSAHKCAGRPANGCRATTPVKLLVSRNGKARTVSVRPEYESALGHTRIGFSYGTRPAQVGVLDAADRAGSFAWLVTHKTLTVFANIFNEKARKQVSGVVGVSDVAHQTIGLGAVEALTLLAVVSLSLGLINLFPFLPLDGGHIFWSLVEKVRGRPVSYRVMERAGALGFVLVIMLFFIGLSNDIGRLTGEGFNVR